jgi:hypothetical protein
MRALKIRNLRAGVFVPTSHGPSVWTDRALQAKNDDSEMIGLALLYPARERNCCTPGHHGYSRALDLIRVSAPKGPPDHERAGETFSPSPHSDSQTSAGKPNPGFGIS